MTAIAGASGSIAKETSKTRRPAQVPRRMQFVDEAFELKGIPGAKARSEQRRGCGREGR